MPYAYIKLHRSFITGTMYDEAAYTKVLFLTILLECTEGVIVATNEHLARTSNLKPEAVEKAMEALQRPDPKSTSPEEEGRRIVPVPGARNTFRIVNWAKYQPALSNDSKDKPKIIVVDPETGERVERLLPSGESNPLYLKLYQRAYREHKRKEEAASLALDSEIESIGVNNVNTLRGSSIAAQKVPPSDRISVNTSTASGGIVEPKNGENGVNNVNNVNKRKENKRKDTTTPYPPSKNRKPAGSSKALQRGEPANELTWEQFDASYPRPGNGRSLERADARITWDALAAAGENMAAIVEGARRYASWITQLGKQEFVAMMTTWLNNRRWEESWYIHPDSDDGRKLAQRRIAEENDRKAMHVAMYRGDYDEFVGQIIGAGIQDEKFLERWRTQAENTLLRRKQMGMAAGVRAAEAVLSDPDAAEADQIRFWKETHSIPGFWDWDLQHNPKSYK